MDFSNPFKWIYTIHIYFILFNFCVVLMCNILYNSCCYWWTDLDYSKILLSTAMKIFEYFSLHICGNFSGVNIWQMNCRVIGYICTFPISLDTAKLHFKVAVPLAIYESSHFLHLSKLLLLTKSLVFAILSCKNHVFIVLFCSSLFSCLTSYSLLILESKLLW